MKVNYMFILPQLSFKNKNPPKPQITHYLKCWPNKQKYLIQFLLCLEEQMGWYKPHLEEYTVKTDYNQSKCNQVKGIEDGYSRERFGLKLPKRR